MLTSQSLILWREGQHSGDASAQGKAATAWTRPRTRDTGLSVGNNIEPFDFDLVLPAEVLEYSSAQSQRFGCNAESKDDTFTREFELFIALKPLPVRSDGSSELLARILHTFPT